MLSHPESPVSSQQESVLSCQQLWRSPTDSGIAFWCAIKCDVAGCRCQEIHCECMRDAVRLKEGSGSCKYLLRHNDEGNLMMFFRTVPILDDLGLFL